MVRNLVTTALGPREMRQQQPLALFYADHRLVWPGGSARAAAGRGGVRTDKREGDGATPAGTYPLLSAMYRADRLAPPVTELPLTAIRRDHVWIDDPAAADYNRLALLPCAVRHEVLWRDDGLYDLLVVIGYNMTPQVAGAGSAIFLHVAGPDFAATEGCIAVTRETLNEVVGLLRPGSTITIRA